MTVKTCPSMRTSLPTGVFVRGEKRIGGVGAEHDNWGAVLLVGVVEKAAALDVQVIDLRDRRRIALQDDVLDAQVAAANETGACAKFEVLDSRRRRGGHDVRQARQTFGPFGFELLALKFLGRTATERDERKAVADDHIRAERFDLANNVVVQSIDYRADGDHGADADDDAEHGEERTQWDCGAARRTRVRLLREVRTSHECSP